MRILIPFKKEIVFKDSLFEITSISLEQNLSIKDEMVNGSFYITGEYKTSENSQSVLPFNLELPICELLDEQYESSTAICDIDDFYYEIINNRKLSISIDISVDKLKLKEIPEEKIEISTIEGDDEVDNTDLNDVLKKIEEVNEMEFRNDKINNFVEGDIVEEMKEKKEVVTESVNMNSLFNNISKTEEYLTYNIYIVRDGDTIDTILAKYNVDVELLKEYNDLSDLKIGDKIIIPSC